MATTGQVTGTANQQYAWLRSQIPVLTEMSTGSGNAQMDKIVTALRGHIQAMPPPNMSGGQFSSGATNPANTAYVDPSVEAARLLKQAQADYDEELLVITIKEEAERKVDKQKKLRDLLVMMNATE